jgi:predicted outer membrane repeat protein
MGAAFPLTRLANGAVSLIAKRKGTIDRPPGPFVSEAGCDEWLRHNTSGTQGGGLRFDLSFHQHQIPVNDVYVIQNTAASGGGIFNAQKLVVSGSVIADNQPDNCLDSGGTGCP